MNARKVAVEIAVGILVGDFLVAAGHWLEDTYLPYTREDSWLGAVARENEMHHFIPYSITTYPWYDNIKTTAIMSLAFGVLLLLAFPKFTRRHWVGVATLLLVGTLSNYFHRMSHERDCAKPALVKMLHASGVLCGSEQHKLHHEHPTVKYGVVLGFTNAVYDGCGVWRALEALLGAFGLQPAPKPGVDAYKPHYDAWLRTNLAKPCPRRISKTRLERYKQILDDIS